MSVESNNICPFMTGLMFMRFTHVVRYIRTSFFFKTEWYSLEWIYQIFLIHSSMDEHLDCFHLVATTNSSTTNNDIHISVRVSAFSYFVYILRSEIVGSCGNSVWFLEKSPHNFPQRLPFYIPISNVWRFQFLPVLNLLFSQVLLFLNNSHVYFTVAGILFVCFFYSGPLQICW